MDGAEHRRLLEDSRRQRNWKRWGPYLSERQWGTVREDYSSDGSCWSYLTHDQSRSRAYRWGEDGLLGITDRQCRLCFGWALWNERDPILKERLFGLTGPEGNHGEDVKELYYYLDSLPTHAYLKALYKYPHGEFPYDRLVEENRRRGRGNTTPEFELVDTGLFDDGRYFDVEAEYAKESPDDLLIRLTITNRSAAPTRIHVLPQLWFRNTWSWGRSGEGYTSRPSIALQDDGSFLTAHETLEPFVFRSAFGNEDVTGTPIFTGNETNRFRLYGIPNDSPYVKDAFHEYVIGGRSTAVDPGLSGTKSAVHYRFELPAFGSITVKFRLTKWSEVAGPASAGFDEVFEQRRREADEFYREVIPPGATHQEALVSRQAYAGLLWSKQFYYYSVEEWLQGDPTQPAPNRSIPRNTDWSHLYNRDIISMPDKWEYPWYAAWDLAFHMVAFADIDPAFAKRQLILLLREWYMHPNGQIPAYEFALSDVNPPVHAWACWRVYKICAPRGHRDTGFLSRVFQKLLINFTWWVNRKDIKGRNLFSGGFLGLDNIGVFDRGAPLPVGEHLEQADATAWMAFYCSNMLVMALELAAGDQAYGDMASKFFEHFIAITDAMNSFGGTGLWDEGDGFYYDQLSNQGSSIPLRVRSLVGLIPLLAVEILEEEAIERLPGFSKRMRWFLDHRRELAQHISYRKNAEGKGLYLLSVPSKERLLKVVTCLLNEEEFLAPHGVRSLSKIHASAPYVFYVGHTPYSVTYCPADSNTEFFGGNSNWRGPIWFPINYLLIEALERYYHFYGDDFRVPCPSVSPEPITLKEAAQELARRLSTIFLPDADGRRACHGRSDFYSRDAAWQDLVLFYEYFNGDDGSGLGASHQTGWTALVARCLQKSIESRRPAGR